MGLPSPADGSAPGYFGLYPALVTNLVDSSNLGRIEVSLPWLGTDGNRDVRAWATLCSPYADNNQGLEILPEVGSQVLVAFEAGNLRRPYIIGAAWNGQESLPNAPDSANNLRVWQSRSGSRLEFDDSTPPKVSITMKSGHKVVLDDAAQQISITHASGCSITLTVTGIEINANVSVDVTAPVVNVNAAISTFSGIVEAKTVIADAFVISPAYTPGVGNLL
jgi:uncharacterized protein involved in type VI secretion and phage assembly